MFSGKHVAALHSEVDDAVSEFDLGCHEDEGWSDVFHMELVVEEVLGGLDEMVEDEDDVLLGEVLLVGLALGDFGVKRVLVELGECLDFVQGSAGVALEGGFVARDRWGMGYA